MATQNDENNSWALGLCTGRFRSQEGASNIPNDQQTGGPGGGTKRDPRHNRKRNDRQDDGWHERDQRISIHGQPFSKRQRVHAHAAGRGHPQDCGQDKGKTHENRCRVQQVVNVVIEFVHIVSMDITVHVCRDLHAFQRSNRGKCQKRRVSRLIY